MGSAVARKSDLQREQSRGDWTNTAHPCRILALDLSVEKPRSGASVRTNCQLRTCAIARKGLHEKPFLLPHYFGHAAAPEIAGRGEARQPHKVSCPGNRWLADSRRKRAQSSGNEERGSHACAANARMARTSVGSPGHHENSRQNSLRWSRVAGRRLSVL